LIANGLIPQEHIADISSRMVVNKASMKMKHASLKHILDKVSEAVNRS
jgi:ATP phosphoribosyltransferase